MLKFVCCPVEEKETIIIFWVFRMNINEHWGKSVAINLYDCDIEKITTKKIIVDFFHAIIPEIGMIAHGPLHIERFGLETKHPGPGYSAMQFIETSSITLHCDEPGRRCFIDIFSCKDFDVSHAVSFTKKFFKAKREQSFALDR